MKTWMKVGIGAVVLLGAGAGTFRVLRGPAGATTAYGGSIEARAMPELTSLDAGAWVNGAPTSLASLRGSPVLLEIWSPT